MNCENHETCYKKKTYFMPVFFNVLLFHSQLESPGFNKCPNEACNYGYHPIHLAARNASIGVLEALLKFADSRGCIREKMITIPDLEGNVPLHLAVHGGEIKVR